MASTVLLLDPDVSRGDAFVALARARSVDAVAVTDTFAAMAALRNDDIDVFLAYSPKAIESLNGLFGIARRKASNAALFVIGEEVDVELPAGVHWLQSPLRAPEFHEALDAGDGRPYRSARLSTPPAGFMRDLMPSPEAILAPPAPLLIEGTLSPGGARMVMGLFAQELTGRVYVDGAGFACLFLQRGVPVWVELVGGDAALLAELRQRNILLDDDDVGSPPEGQLFSSLLGRGIIAPAMAESYMRQSLRTAVKAIAIKPDGPYRFVEDARLGEAPPLVRVNPFGLIFESLRERATPDAILRYGREYRDARIRAQPGLFAARDKVSPFVCGKDITEVADGRTVEEFNTAVGLDELTGTQVVLALERSGLCSLERQQA